MGVFSFFATVMLASANGLSCQEYESAYDEAVQSVCDKTWGPEDRKSTTGLSCQTELKKAKKFYFQCLNGNLDADKKKVQSGDEEGSACVKFGDLAVGKDTEVQLASGDALLWSGFSSEEQLNFKSWRLVGAGEHPMILGRTWVSDLLSTLEERGRLPAEDYAGCIENPDSLNNKSPVPEDPSDYCKDPCRWHSDMTIKPWEGMSQAVAKSFYNISDDETRRNEIYVLLNKWSEDSVFAQTELVTFLKQEMQKSLNWHHHHQAGTLDIRVRKKAYAKKAPANAEFDPATMVEVDGVNRYQATCKEIVKFVADEQEKELQANAFTGYKLVCIKCYEDCSGDFRTPEEDGTCVSVLSDGCNVVKEEL